MASFLEQLFKSGGARKKVSNKEKKCRSEGYKQCVGSKRQVWHGTAKQTPGGVTKGKLSKKSDGRIVFRSKSLSAAKSNNLGLGVRIFSKKGHFGPLTKSGKKYTKQARASRRSSRRFRARRSRSRRSRRSRR